MLINLHRTFSECQSVRWVVECSTALNVAEKRVMFERRRVCHPLYIKEFCSN
jgi:hypothetical protein